MTKPILLSIDLSAPSSWQHALPVALGMCHDAPLHVITVVPNFGMSIVGGFFDEGFAARALHEVGAAMNKWVNDNVPDEADVHPHVTHGRVYEEILRAADRLEVGTIVLGSHTPELTDYLLGPNAARVVRHARQSVYVVRG
ncbi:hypothetical protein LCGC14_2900420 [marine sediment metagenome]|uniref:UspA domain-containing protein n=1 Tax=marine sediment metagenome TaxID=412755 RepID=A0A0F8XUX8_9ZZZZ